MTGESAEYLLEDGVRLSAVSKCIDLDLETLFLMRSVLFSCVAFRS